MCREEKESKRKKEATERKEDVLSETSFLFLYRPAVPLFSRQVEHAKR